MQKDFSSRKYAAKRGAKQGRGVWILILTLMVLLFAGAAYFVYLYKRQPVQPPAVTSFFAELQHWFADRKQNLHQGLATVKKLSENPETPPEQIHFEFYTALPNMHVPVAQVEEKQQKAEAHENVNTKQLFSAAELEQDFSEHYIEAKNKGRK